MSGALLGGKMDVDVLLPSGFLLITTCSADVPLCDFKKLVWSEARKLGLPGETLDQDSYVFSGVILEGSTEDFLDETQRLSQLRLFIPMLSLRQSHDMKSDKTREALVFHSIGVSAKDLGRVMDAEATRFRSAAFATVKDACQRTRSGGADQVFHFRAGAACDPDAGCSISRRSHSVSSSTASSSGGGGHSSSFDRLSIGSSSGNAQMIQVFLRNSQQTASFTIKLDPDRSLPSTVVEEVARKLQYRQQIDPAKFLVKVCCCNQYLTSRVPLSAYDYFRHCSDSKTTPRLMLVEKDASFDSVNEPGGCNYYSMPEYLSNLAGGDRTSSTSAYAMIRDDSGSQQHVRNVDLWSGVSEYFTIRISSVQVAEAPNCQLYLRAGVYCGSNPLSGNLTTRAMRNCGDIWSEPLMFDVLLCDLPIYARLCLALCYVVRRHTTDEHNCLGWSNVNIFDYDGNLRHGSVQLRFWTDEFNGGAPPAGSVDFLNPLGTTFGSNQSDAPMAEVLFPDVRACFPSEDKLNSLVQHPPMQSCTRQGWSYIRPQQEEQLLKDLKATLRKDCLNELTDNERDLLWYFRQYCCAHEPNSLPLLASAVNWANHNEVFAFYCLLDQWKRPLQLHTSLQLLGPIFMDPRLRSLAVDSLNSTINDKQFCRLLLQLVQCLKFEPFLSNRLTHFLLRWALRNVRYFKG